MYSDNDKAMRVSDMKLPINFAQISDSLNNMKVDIEQNLKLISAVESIFYYDAQNRRSCSEKMIEISELQDNWNENGAKKFNDKLIVKCYSILFGLSVLPEIFPVADGSIQFEYEKSDGSYLEFDIFENEVSEFIVFPDGKEIERTIESGRIAEEVEKFYDRSDK